LASALALGGCVSIKSVTAVQQDVGGPMRITLVVCAVDRGTTIDHPGCNLQSNLAEGVPGMGQLLVALGAPEGTTAPQTVTGTTNDASASTLELTRDATYEDELRRLLPVEGRTWVGYRSATYDYDDGANGTPAREVSLSVDLTLPRPADGAPYVGALPIVPVAGGRIVSVTASEARPVACGTSAFASSSDSTICVDSPLAAQIDSPYTFPTRDFGIVAGTATASPGQTVALPFNVRGAGALPAGLDAGLSASTGLPGVAVAPSVPSAALSNGSDTRVTVPVAIPAGAAAGTYEVALVGRLENGQERRGVAQLTVRARPEPPNVAPVVSGLRVKPKAFKPATRRKPKRGADVAYTLSEAASVRVVVERCSKYAKPKGKRRGKAKGKRSAVEVAARKRVARGRCLSFKAMNGARTKAGQTGANGFRFNGKVAGKTLKPGAYRLAQTATDAAGARGDVVRAPFSIKR
jgi:hypothetical protein